MIAALYASIRDLELVEDALQDALVLAIEHWPVDGVPPNPGAWITIAARRKAIDRLRREHALNHKKASLKMLMEFEQEGNTVETGEIPDERLDSGLRRPAGVGADSQVRHSEGPVPVGKRHGQRVPAGHASQGNVSQAIMVEVPNQHLDLGRLRPDRKIVHTGRQN